MLGANLPPNGIEIDLTLGTFKPLGWPFPKSMWVIVIHDGTSFFYTRTWLWPVRY